MVGMYTLRYAPWWACTPLGIAWWAYTPGIAWWAYTPWGMRGVPRLYHPGSERSTQAIPPGYIHQDMLAIHHPGYVPPRVCRLYTTLGMYPPVYPWVHLPPYRTLVYLYLRTLVWRCRTSKPWAQRGRNPWVREPLSLSGSLKCERWWETLRRTLPSLPEERMKDWITQGTSLLYSLRLGHAAQSPLFLGRPSDR